MKANVLAFLSLFIATSLFAQESKWHYTEEFYFVKEVPVKEYRGHQFRYEIAVKSMPGDSLSKPRIHGINVGKGPDDFLRSNFSLETRQEQDWTVYTIVGTIDPEAFKLWFYTAVNGNGEFYFDDISFYVEVSPGYWKQLPLFNASFENGKKNIFDGFYVSGRNSKWVQTKITNTVVKSGQKALMVNSTGQKPIAFNY
ncbi:MAG: hypothetical protein K2P88_03565 [Chitinophagaceae bacterium]|nr:hypothetical protein [Chitinophagaceae bacterium]